MRNVAVSHFVKDYGIALSFLGFVSLLYLVIASEYGGHPFDNIVFKTWIYSGQVDGLSGVYVRSSSAGDAFMRGDGLPWSSLGFAYEPLAALIFFLISICLPPLASFSSQSVMFASSALEAEIKWSLGLFTLTTGGVIYWAVLRAGRSRTRALLAMAIFVLNPAIIYDSVVWGETDAFLYLAFIVFALLASKHRTLATATALLALAIKQTGIILLVPTVLLFLEPGLGISRRLGMLGKALPALFAVLVLLILGGMLPSTFIKPLTTKLQDVGGVVSPDTYTFWTVFTPLSRATGSSLIQYSSASPVLGPIPFSWLGYLAFGTTAVVISNSVRPFVRKTRPVFWHAVVALTAIAFVSLLTGAASRYYTLSIPCLTTTLALGWDELSPRLRAGLIAVLVSISSVALWTMAGIFTWIMNHEFPNIHGLEPWQNPLMRIVDQYYLSVFAVVVGSLAIIASLVFLAWLVPNLAKRETS